MTNLVSSIEIIPASSQNDSLNVSLRSVHRKPSSLPIRSPLACVRGYCPLAGFYIFLKESISVQLLLEVDTQVVC